jgi:hypothetical protein
MKTNKQGLEVLGFPVLGDVSSDTLKVWLAIAAGVPYKASFNPDGSFTLTTEPCQVVLDVDGKGTCRVFFSRAE